jgi:hypothetical protein
MISGARYLIFNYYWEILCLLAKMQYSSPWVIRTVGVGEVARMTQEFGPRGDLKMWVTYTKQKHKTKV